MRQYKNNPSPSICSAIRDSYQGIPDLADMAQHERLLLCLSNIGQIRRGRPRMEISPVHSHVAQLYTGDCDHFFYFTVNGSALEQRSYFIIMSIIIILCAP